MVAVMGVTGQVGSAVAHNLLANGVSVRALVRESSKADSWARRGCEWAVADVNSPGDLTRAFQGAEAVFVMLPPTFDPEPGFTEARIAIASLLNALKECAPGRLVVLSTIGGQIKRANLLNQLNLLEEALGTLSLQVTFLRPAWFMENSRWDVAPARETGVVSSFLEPLDKKFPMIATRDVGEVAAELLQEDWPGNRVVEIEGPSRVSPNEIAACMEHLIGREVRAQLVPRERWEHVFRSQGMKNPTSRMQMLDGFNDGWIEFESGKQGSRKTKTSLTAALKSVIQESR